MSTTHPVAPDEIMALLDGELSADRGQSVSAHIDQCAECGAFARELQTSSRNLTQWQVGSLPSNIDEALKGFTGSLAPGAGKLSSRIFYRPALWTWKHWTLGLGTAVGALFLLLLAATPALHRSEMAARQASEVGRARRKEAANGISVDNTITDSSKVRGLVTLTPTVDDSHVKITTMSGPTLSEPMIVRTVSLSIAVKNFDAGRASLDAILARHNGYAAGLNVATPQGAARMLQASLRIPATHLAPAVAELKALDRVEAETQNGEEVTQQHADLVARLKNSRETEQRLQDVLRTRTGKVKDVLEVEEEIARVRGEIEQMEAEQQTLEHRVTFATIDLKLAEEYKAQISSPAPSVAMQVRNAIVNGFRNAFDSLLGIILFFAEIVPMFVLWLVILFFPSWMLWRRYRRAYAMGTSL